MIFALAENVNKIRFKFKIVRYWVYKTLHVMAFFDPCLNIAYWLVLRSIQFPNFVQYIRDDAKQGSVRYVRNFKWNTSIRSNSFG